MVKQPIWIGGILMKYLMVDNGRVFYSLDGSAASKKPIDQISKDDLLILLKLAISEESFEMDPYSTESVHNAAHQIIYKNIYQKFEDIRLHRVSFEDEKVNLYRTAINRYSSELSEYK